MCNVLHGLCKGPEKSLKVRFFFKKKIHVIDVCQLDSHFILVDSVESELFPGMNPGESPSY